MGCDSEKKVCKSAEGLLLKLPPESSTRIDDDGDDAGDSPMMMKIMTVRVRGMVIIKAMVMQMAMARARARVQVIAIAVVAMVTSKMVRQLHARPTMILMVVFV